jgi:hypothetical protein
MPATPPLPFDAKRANLSVQRDGRPKTVGSRSLGWTPRRNRPAPSLPSPSEAQRTFVVQLQNRTRYCTEGLGELEAPENVCADTERHGVFWCAMASETTPRSSSPCVWKNRTQRSREGVGGASDVARQPIRQCRPSADARRSAGVTATSRGKVQNVRPVERVQRRHDDM